MNKNVLIFALSLLVVGCQSQHSFRIPLFNEIINYEDDEALKSQNDKDAMYFIMLGGIELNQGKTKKAIDYYEKSLSLSKNNKIAYSLINIYYKQNDLQNVKRIAAIINDNKIQKSKSLQDNLIISLLDKNDKESSRLIKESITSITPPYTINSLENTIKSHKEIADIFSFLMIDIDDNDLIIDRDQLVLIKFFYLYNTANKNGKSADLSYTYLVNNRNHDNLSHDFTIFKIGYVENYDVRLYKESLIKLVKNIDDYYLDLNALDKLIAVDSVEYKILKDKCIAKYDEDTRFWHILSALEYPLNNEDSLKYSKKAYDVMKKNDPAYSEKDEIIARLIYSMINQKSYNVKSYILQLNNYKDKKNIFSYLVANMIENNKFKPELIEDYKNVIKIKDLYLLTGRAYAYTEHYDIALEYIDKAKALNANSLEININRIMIIAEINSSLALSEATQLFNKTKTIESELLMYSIWAIRKENIIKGIERVENIYNNTDVASIKIDELKKTPLYLLSEFNYLNGNYDAAKGYMEKIEINYNYIYLADYGKILWKLNDFANAKIYLKQSKQIKDSKYLEKILKELNIKNLGELK